MEYQVTLFITSPTLEELKEFQEADGFKTLNGAAYKLMKMGLYAYQQNTKPKKTNSEYQQNSLWDNFVELSHPEFEDQ